MQEVADGLVLAGGMSRRMGQSKADLPYSPSSTLVQHARDTLKATVSGTVWVSRPYSWSGLSAIDIADEVANQGPLRGILQGLSRTDHQWLAVLAVDCPNVPSELYEALHDARQAQDQVLIPYHGDISQPLASLWSKTLCDAIAVNLNRQQFKVQFLLNQVKAHYVEISHADWLMNLNTPGDWARWQKTPAGQP